MAEKQHPLQRLQNRHPWSFSLLWLCFLCGLAFWQNLGSTGLVDETEPLFAEASRQILVTGDWITPYFNGETRFDKPILIYWLMAICYKLLGVNEWAVRFPSALAATLLTVFCFYTLRYFGFTLAPQKQGMGEKQLWISAWLGTALVTLNMQTMIWARQGVSDMLLSGCMGIALFCFFWGYAKNDINNSLGENNEQNLLFKVPNKWYIGFYVASALAVLTKGPVGFVLPGIIVFVFLVYLGKLKEVLQEIGLFWGAIIVLAINLPWYGLVTLKNGSNFINAFFGYHNFQRFTGVVNQHGAPWYFYFLIVLILFAPWSVYLPLAIAKTGFWQRGLWRRQPRSNQLGLFAFFWFSVVFIFFTIAITKLPSYVLPLIPSASILVALLSTENVAINPREKREWFFTGIFNLIFIIILTIAFILSPYFIGNDPAIVDLPRLISNSGLAMRAGIIWGVTGIITGFLIFRKTQASRLFIPNILGFILFVIFVVTPVTFFIDNARQVPLRELSSIIIREQKPREKILMIGFKKPTVTFYTRQNIEYLNNSDRALEYLENLQKPQDSFLIIGRDKDMKKLILENKSYTIIAEKAPYQLIRLIR